MTIFIALIAFIFALCLIISIHELGHFIFAKKAGILCYDYSIGMGPLIWSKKKGETVYGIRAVPIGGFVSMAGEEISNAMIKEDQEIGLNFDDGVVKEIVLNNIEKSEVFGKVVKFDLYDEKNNGLFIELLVDGIPVTYSVKEDAMYVESEKKQLQIAPYSRSFESKTLWQRFITIFAGPAMNFILAFFLFLIVCFSVGEADVDSNKIGSITENYSIAGEKTNTPAYGNLKKGDKIIQINGEEVNDWNDLSKRLDACVGLSDINIKLVRKGITMDTVVHPIIYIGNLGVFGNTAESEAEGVKIYIYTTKAKEAGLKDGDVITSLTYGGEEHIVNSWLDMENCSSEIDGETIKVKIMRDGVEKSVSVDTLSNKTLKVVGIERSDILLGISPTYHFTFFGSFKNAFVRIGDVVVEVFGTLGLLFGGSSDVGVSDLSGPVGIFTLVKNALTGGLISYISFIAFLSVNIGLINILPIPALDGGRLVFLGYEAVTRKKANKKVENTIHTVMLVLLMILFVYITFNDVTRLFG